jgi:hypothetical protein
MYCSYPTGRQWTLKPLNPKTVLSQFCKRFFQVSYHQLARVCANTTLCAAFAGCTAYIATTRHGGSPPDHLINAVLGRCVAACATSSIVDSWAAAVIGTVAGLIYLGAVKLMVSLYVFYASLDPSLRSWYATNLWLL